jgi:LemA protein
MSTALPLSRRSGAISRGVSIVLALVAVLVVFGLFVASKYNSLQAKKTRVEAQISALDAQYKRRFDLIPNLVETVKGAADFEKSTLEAVTEARANVGRAQLPPDLTNDPAKLDAYIKAQQQLGAAIGRLFAVAENYPQLRATERFGELQAQIEGTENRITVARQDYIEAVRDYNTSLRTFPSNLIAGLFNFRELPQFSIDANERAVPKVDFGAKK